MDNIPECCFEGIRDNSEEIRPRTKSNVITKDLCPQQVAPISTIFFNSSRVLGFFPVYSHSLIHEAMVLKL